VRRAGRLLPTIALGLALGLACGDERGRGAAAPAAPAPAAPASPDAPPGARLDLVEVLRADRAAPRHPADGAGRAWIEGEARAVALEPGRWTIVYEAGPEGVAVGGAVYLMTSPFWGWSTPQTRAPAVHGYTEVTTDAAGVTLETANPDVQLLEVRIGGRPLARGERIRMDFGAGEAGAGADRFAERGERFWIAVDGDGDGTRRILDGSPTLDIAPNAPARLELTLPSTARPGEPVRLVAAVLDAAGNTGVAWTGAVEVELPDGLDGPSRIALAPADLGRKTVTYTARRPGVLRLRARAGELAAESNPLEVGDGPRVLWADLHGHSNFSDGTGTPEDWFRYARDVAGLDVAALTDHDHWGVRFLDSTPELWDEIRRQVARIHEPGRFVSLLGYEWTSWIHGHRHVLYFGDDGPVVSSLDEATDDPRELWTALAGREALTFAHHSAGGPIPTNWAIPPDPAFEPVTEVASVHGSSEALDAPHLIEAPVAGNTVRDALDRGYRLGFVGSGDGHDGHPGLTHVASATGGVAAILAEDATREAVLAALRARRTYATNGPRVLLRAELAGRPMGSAIAAAELAGGAAELLLRVVAPGEIASVDVVRSGRVVESLPGDGRRELDLRDRLRGLRAGEYVYVRVVQVGGGAAWTSPWFID
jgi:hypothetical protein